MNKLSTLTLIAVFAAAPVATLAQDVGTTVSGAADAVTSATVGAGDASANVGADASVSTDVNAMTNSSTASGSVDANVSASATGQLTYDELLTHLNSTDAATTISIIGTVGADSTITIIPVSQISGGATADAGALAAAETSGNDRLTQVRAAVHANAAIEAKLTAAGYSDSDVLDVEANGSGAVWVYVKDKQ
jgi:hypothetical protein